MRNYWPLAILALLFILPALAAFYTLQYKKQDLQTTQHGVFTDPVPMLQHKWQIIFLNPIPCDAACIARQKLVYNLHSSLGADRNRVVLLNSYANMLQIQEPPGSILIIDPQGYYIMHYPPEQDLMAMRKDIKQLLKYSHAFKN